MTIIEGSPTSNPVLVNVEIPGQELPSDSIHDEPAETESSLDRLGELVQRVTAVPKDR